MPSVVTCNFLYRLAEDSTTLDLPNRAIERCVLHPVAVERLPWTIHDEVYQRMYKLMTLMFAMPVRWNRQTKQFSLALDSMWSPLRLGNFFLRLLASKPLPRTGIRCALANFSLRNTIASTEDFAFRGSAPHVRSPLVCTNCTWWWCHSVQSVAAKICTMIVDCSQPLWCRPGFRVHLPRCDRMSDWTWRHHPFVCKPTLERCNSSSVSSRLGPLLRLSFFSFLFHYHCPSSRWPIQNSTYSPARDRLSDGLAVVATIFVTIVMSKLHIGHLLVHDLEL